MKKPRLSKSKIDSYSVSESPRESAHAASGANRMKLSLPIAALIGLAFVGIFYLYNIFSTVTVQFEVSSPKETVKYGETFDINISVKNDSENILNNVQLSAALPAGVVLANGSANRIYRVNLGDIGKNGTHDEALQFIAAPVEPNDSMDRTIDVSINYSIGSVTAEFRQTKSAKVGVENFPVTLDLIYPDQIIAGSKFDAVAAYANVGNYQSNHLKLQIDYPDVYAKASSSPLSDKLDNVWDLGNLNAGAKGKVTLSGSANLPDGATLDMTAKIIMQILGADYAALSKEIRIPVAPAPLSIKISADNSGTAYKPGDVLNYVLNYQNNTDVSLSDVFIAAKLTGKMFDPNSLNANGGRFDYAKRTIQWDKSSSDGLASLAPHASGGVSFSINLLKDYPIARLNDKNFTVKVDGSIESPTVPEGINAQKLFSSFTLENKVAGNIAVQGTALFRDADSLILNSGPLPPKVGQVTNFTIHWILTNYSTDVQNVDVRAAFPAGATFTGVAKSNIDSTPTYDASTGEVDWKIDRIFATTGLTDDHPEAIFQVVVTPAITDIGGYARILGETSLRADDAFTGFVLNASSPALTTRLEGDKTVSENDGKVAP